MMAAATCFGSFDLAMSIFAYLSAPEIGRCCGVCWRWRKYISSELGDTRLYRSLVKIYMNNVLYTSASSSVPLQFHIELVLVEKVEEILRDAKVDFDAVSSSQDLYKLFIAFLIFGSRSRTITTSVNNNHKNHCNNMVLRSAGSSQQQKKIFYPEWSCNLPAWKATYHYMVADSKRTKLLVSELLNFTWDFRFKYDEVPMDFMYVQFGNDFILRSTRHEVSNVNDNDIMDAFFAHLFHPWNFPWKIIHRRLSSSDTSDHRYLDPIRSRRQKEIDILARKLIYKIQVDQYPILNVSRRQDGLFQLENMYVTFTQRVTDMQDIIHVV